MGEDRRKTDFLICFIYEGTRKNEFLFCFLSSMNELHPRRTIVRLRASPKQVLYSVRPFFIQIPSTFFSRWIRQIPKNICFKTKSKEYQDSLLFLFLLLQIHKAGYNLCKFFCRFVTFTVYKLSNTTDIVPIM